MLTIEDLNERLALVNRGYYSAVRYREAVEAAAVQRFQAEALLEIRDLLLMTYQRQFGESPEALPPQQGVTARSYSMDERSQYRAEERQAFHMRENKPGEEGWTGVLA